MTSEDEEEEKEERAEGRRAARVKRMIEEEARLMFEDESTLAAEELKVLRRLKEMVERKEEEEEEEDVLQTKVVTTQEASRDWARWLPAIDAEVQSLLVEKQAMREVKKAELEQMIREADKKGKRIVFLPSKMVFTVKPGPQGGKRKARWVICGNYEQKREEEENYSSGADAAAFRLLIATAVDKQWEGGTLDIKSAFLNADIEMEEDEAILIVRPPAVFAEKRYKEPDSGYIPIKAVYGLRRSPKLWGNHRDLTLEEMRVMVQEEGKMLRLRLTSLASEPNLWKIEEEKEEGGEEEEKDQGRELRGLLMTYVDDTFVTGSKEVVKAVMEEIQKRWTTSTPDEVSSSPISFLGMEVRKESQKGEENEVWYVTQTAYINDLLSKMEAQVKPRKVPITRDQCQIPKKQSRT